MSKGIIYRVPKSVLEPAKIVAKSCGVKPNELITIILKNFFKLKVPMLLIKEAKKQVRSKSWE